VKAKVGKNATYKRYSALDARNANSNIFKWTRHWIVGSGNSYFDPSFQLTYRGHILNTAHLGYTMVRPGNKVQMHDV
jgi:hypothetical protein